MTKDKLWNGNIFDTLLENRVILEKIEAITGTT